MKLNKYKWLKGKVWDNFGNWKAFKNNEKCFLFHLESSFHSQEIKIFVFTF